MLLLGGGIALNYHKSYSFLPVTYGLTPVQNMPLKVQVLGIRFLLGLYIEKCGSTAILLLSDENIIGVKH